MRIPIAQLEWMGWRINSLTPDYILPSIPEAGYPNGRKGKLIWETWEAFHRGVDPGMILMDPDVVADPDDLAALLGAACSDLTSVHTAAVKLWPLATGLPAWMWSHRGGRLGYPENTQSEHTAVKYFSTGMVYLPARLLDAASEWLPAAHFLDVDPQLSETALKVGIPMWVCWECRPKHLHFTREHNARIPKPDPQTAGPPSGGTYHPPA